MSEEDPAAFEAQRDALTGLPGLDSFRARIGHWAARDAEQGEGPSLHALLLGMRRFDALNLAYGAESGDAALTEVAARLARFAEAELGGPWIAARSGGSNFVLAASEACSRERWQHFAGQLADLAAAPIAAPGGVVRLSPRVALLRGIGGEAADSVLDRLGRTLAGMHRQNGARIAWADGESTRPGRTAAELETDLLQAIDRDEIEVVFQPQFALADDRLSGAEALARWNHPEIGRIGAGTLFSMAERTDHVAPLSRHIARLALEGAAELPGHLRLSLNVTAIELSAENYAPELMTIVRASRFPLERLTLEVTEQALLTEIELAARELGRLSGQGVKVALDDFGAGFCNFRYLKLLPLDYLKLDRAMIEGVAHDSRDLAVFRGIVAMAKALDLEVVVEGVETEDQRRIAADEGCGYYQGFLRAQPMPAADFAGLV
ncbi:MAG: EAL domain-containing protein [Novosphingobium sp.]